jgi:2-polyprenyl-6-methoxyphenol hydroxylase-like FAD-dependent oxidoreductase
VPREAAPLLGNAHGHSYHLFTPEHLAGCQRDDVLLAGDALGLAHPLTGEGILPAVLSGKLAAEAVLRGTSYREALERHPVIRDYALARAALTLGIALRRRVSRATPPAKPSGRASFVDAAAARGFARLFSGEPLPGSNLLGAALLLASSITHESFSQ